MPAHQSIHKRKPFQPARQLVSLALFPPNSTVTTHCKICECLGKICAENKGQEQLEYLHSSTTIDNASASAAATKRVNNSQS